MLLDAYRRRGIDSRLVVGFRASSDPDVLTIPSGSTLLTWYRGWQGLSKKLAARGVPVLPRACWWVANAGDPIRMIGRELGIEDYRFPGSRRFIEQLPWRPDIIHAHNLHGGYFDLRVLPVLSQCSPVLLTMHDAWLITGHCAHSFGCERWKTGCGQCPNLTTPPSVKRDATAYNWKRKKAIFSNSQVFISAPSRWLLDRALQSLMGSAIQDGFVIPNGADLTLFHPGDRAAARSRLGWDAHSTVLLFSANFAKSNPFKDYQTARKAAAIVASRSPSLRLVLVCLGEHSEDEIVGNALVRHVPFVGDQHVVADHLRASDIYLHAAKAEVFPLSIIEAMSCARPVVATATGGIPEMITDGLDGLLCPPGDAEAMAACVSQLLERPKLAESLAQNALKTSTTRFTVDAMVTGYLDAYDRMRQTDRRAIG